MDDPGCQSAPARVNRRHHGTVLPGDQDGNAVGGDDSDWLPIRPGLSWEKQGFPDYDGYAWYRIHVRLPESLRNDPSVRRHQSLTVTLGKIDDVDQTWFNGKVIGTTGLPGGLQQPRQGVPQSGTD